MRATQWAVVMLTLWGCGEIPRPAAKPEAPPAAVKITHFYISPPVVEAGRPALLCYGVENARRVRLDPPVEELRPSYNRCLQVAPVRDTRYTLFAEGADGREVSVSAELKVRRRVPSSGGPPKAESLIMEFAATATETQPGRPVTVCYQVAPGAAVQLEPEVKRPSGERACFSVSPEETTTYTLIASDESGRQEKRAVKIAVR